MDVPVSGVGGLIERLADQFAQDQVTPAKANETRQLVAFAADIRDAMPAFSSPLKSPVNPGALAMELLKRLEPFLKKAHEYGRIPASDDLAGPLPFPMARAGVAFANRDPTDIHPGPARKNFALPVPKIGGEIEGRLPEPGFEGTVDLFYDSIIADLFGSDEYFRQWSNDMIGDIFKARIFDAEFTMVARGLRGATDALSALTTRQS